MIHAEKPNHNPPSPKGLSIRGELKPFILSASGAILLVLAYPRFNISVFAWLSFVPLFLAIRNQNGLKRLASGFIFGFIFFYGTLYWINNSVIVYGGVKWYVSIFIVAILVTYLALYMSLFVLLLPILRPYLFNSYLITAPALFVSLEHLRSWFFTGFGFSSLGYSQSYNLPIIQIADITGQYGVSFVIILVNAGIYSIFAEDKTKGEKIRTIAVICSVFFAMLVYGFITLNSTKEAPTIRSSVIQPDIPQDVKNERWGKKSIWEDCVELTLKTAKDKPEIVVWPESATGTIFNDSFELHKQLSRLTKALGCDIILGSVYRKGGKEIFNTAFHISKNGKVKNRYDKIHLLPFGEYMPLPKIFFFISRLVPAISDFSPGKEYKLFTLNESRKNYRKIKFSVTICYESLFPNMMRRFVKRGAFFLINISNDAWFGKTAGPYQHFDVNIFRAIENRIPIIRSANTGISGFIDKYGRVIQRTPTFTKTHISSELELRNEVTFYTRFGDIFAYLCMLIAICALLASKFSPKSIAVPPFKS